MAQRPNTRFGALSALIVVLAIFLVVQHYRAYFTAGTHDLTTAQRTATIKSALKRGDIAALRERGEMVLLGRENIADVLEF